MWVYVVRLSVVLEITQIAGIEAKNQEKFFIILSLAFYTYSMSEQRFKNFIASMVVITLVVEFHLHDSCLLDGFWLQGAHFDQASAILF